MSLEREDKDILEIEEKCEIEEECGKEEKFEIEEECGKEEKIEIEEECGKEEKIEIDAEICETEKDRNKEGRQFCKHLQDYKMNKNLLIYRKIFITFVSCKTKADIIRKYHLCYCKVCNTRKHRLHACLICPYFGCYENNHLQEHAEAKKHNLAVDITTGNIYCFICKEYIYDKHIEDAQRRLRMDQGKYAVNWFPKESVSLVKEDEVYFLRDYRFEEPYEPLETATFVQRPTEDSNCLRYKCFVTFVNKEKVKEESSEMADSTKDSTQDSNKNIESVFKVPFPVTSKSPDRIRNRRCKATDSTGSASQDSTTKVAPQPVSKQSRRRRKKRKPSKMADSVKQSSGSIEMKKTQTEDLSEMIYSPLDTQEPVSKPPDQPGKRSKVNAKSSSSDVIPQYNPKTFGLRGLVNMNNTTCYLNSILQVLIHIPCLRNLFLSFKHNPQTCCFGVKERCACLACEMILLTEEFFSGKTEPITTEHIFCLIWKHMLHQLPETFSPSVIEDRKEMMRDHQDSHEILILILQLLHENMKDADEKDSNCNCCIHQLFTGVLQEEFCCSVCGTKRSKFEEFNILSFGLGITSRTTGKTPEDLMNCIEMHMAPEELPIQCHECDTAVQMEKIQKFYTTPVIMCFHFKRLLGNRKFIDTLISFPEYLDITPYSRVATIDESDTKDMKISSNCYVLTGVICYIRNGHYISFIKMHGKWFKCDDDRIYEVDNTDELKNGAYLLFYQKEKLQNAVITKADKEAIAKRNLKTYRRLYLLWEVKTILEEDILKLKINAD